MIILKEATTDKLRISLSAAIHVHTACHFVDTDGTMTGSSSVVSDRELHDLTATGDIVAKPTTSGYVRNVKQMSFVNVDASSSVNVQVLYNNNGTEYKITPLITLLAGEALKCNGDGVWFHHDANGGVYGVGQTFALQTDMETGTSTTLVVSPGIIKYHPSSVKAWLSCGVAADIQQSYNIASLTDTGTGVVTVTFTTSQSAATYCVVPGVEATQVSSWSVVNQRIVHLRFNTRATGSFAMDCTDSTATTNVLKDPNTWHCVVLGDFA